MCRGAISNPRCRISIFSRRFEACRRDTVPCPDRRLGEAGAENLRRVADAGKPMIIRVPLIPQFNADEASVSAIVNFAADELGVSAIHFLPYHTLGMNKYALLNQPYHAPDKPLDDPALLTFAQHYAAQKA